MQRKHLSTDAPNMTSRIKQYCGRPACGKAESSLPERMVTIMINECDNVAVIDADHTVRKALKMMLEAVGLTVALFRSAEEYLRTSKSYSYNCIVIDPGHSLDFQAKLARANNPTPIVLIAAHGDIRMSVRAMKAGAIEFLTKPFRNQDLLDAVRDGIARDRARRAEHKVTSELLVRFASLTPREREVMALLSAGRDVKGIAGQMNTCTHTARVHRSRVMSKIGARSIADLVRISDTLGNRTDRGQAGRMPNEIPNSVRA
jgi:FixJ family two-component response regulator